MAEGKLVIKGEPVEPEVRDLISLLYQNAIAAKNTINMLHEMLSKQIETLRTMEEKGDVKGTIATLIKIKGFASEMAEMAKMYADTLTLLASKPRAATAMRLMLRD